MTIGYIALDDWTPVRKLYAYMDTADSYRADALFCKYRDSRGNGNLRKDGTVLFSAAFLNDR